jgi:hypothetical protein
MVHTHTHNKATGTHIRTGPATKISFEQHLQVIKMTNSTETDLSQVKTAQADIK